MLYYNTKTGDEISYQDIAQVYNVSLPNGSVGPDEQLVAKLNLVPIVMAPDKPDAEWFEEVNDSGALSYTPGDDAAVREWVVVQVVSDMLNEDGNIVKTKEQIRDEAAADAEAAEAQRVLDEEAEAVRVAEELARGKLDHQRMIRNMLLRETDVYTVSDYPHADDAAKAAWLTYRQELRDLPAHANWSDLQDEDWPTAPDASEDESE